MDSSPIVIFQYSELSTKNIFAWGTPIKLYRLALRNKRHIFCSLLPKHIMKPIRFLLNLALLMYACIISCKKENNQANDFSWSGLTIVGDSILFTPNGSGSMHWDFGDSVSSSESRPYHIYGHPGTFTVKLLVNNNNAYRIDKPISVVVNPVYTPQMAGNWLWRHSYTLYHYPLPADTISYNDTSFTIKYIDMLSVSIGPDTLVYSGTNGDSTLTYSHTYYIDLVYPSGSYDELFFNHFTNSLVFQKNVHISAGASSTDTYITP